MSRATPELPEGFEIFVETEIQPLFDALQAARAEGRSWMMKFGPIGALVGAGGGFWLYNVQPKLWILSLVFTLIGAVLGLVPGLARLSTANDDFGNVHVEKVAAFLGLNHQAKDFEPPRFETFLELDLVPRGDRQSFSHLVSGKHNGADFSIYEAFVEERRTRTTTDSEGNTRTETYWATIFQGQLLWTPYPRKFACTTIIARDHGWFNTKGRFGKTMKPMGLADPHFEKLFEVYTTDQVEGRYLVDPAFMTRLMELEDNHKDRKTTAAFFEKSVYVALRGKSEFFGSLGKEATPTSVATETIAAFQNIYRFMDMLKGKRN
jgi:uncharacterized membrane protein YeaQ/YmgE (transglycosylase-associated protein family)